jgi:hypothetical protein
VINLGLSPTEQRRFHRLLASSHWIKVEVSILNLDEDELQDVSDMLIDGQVTIDESQSPGGRMLEISLLDPSHKLHLDTDSPSDAALFADRMIAVRYVVISPDFSFRVEIPVFKGVISDLDRTEAVVDLTASGKESLGQGNAWQRKTWKKHTRRTTIINYILTEVIGEPAGRKIPSLKNRIPRPMSIGPDTVPMALVQSMAHSLGRQFFFDGRGRPRFRNEPSNVCYVFRDGVGGTVKSRPKAGFSMDEVYNAVLVIGKKPRGKKRVKFRAVADEDNPLSPARLKRNGAKRYIPRVIEDSSIKTVKGARTRARASLKRGLRMGTEVAFDSLPVPHLEPGDMVKVDTREFSTTFRLTKMTIPLNSEASATIGYVKNVKVRANRIRTGRRRRK